MAKIESETRSKTAFDVKKRGSSFWMDPKDLFLVTDPADPLYDERVNLPLDEPLILNIMYHGVIEPVVVTARGRIPVVVDGRQRVKNACEANKRLAEQGKTTYLVECVKRRGDDAALFGVMISANELRRDDEIIVKAQKAAKLLNHGKSEDEVAAVFGRTKATIANWMTLLEAAPEVKAAVESGELPASAAFQIGKKDRDTQVKEAKKAKTRKAQGKPALPRLRTRKEITKRLEDTDISPGYRAALKWVLGA